MVKEAFLWASCVYAYGLIELLVFLSSYPNRPLYRLSDQLGGLRSYSKIAPLSAEVTSRE